MKRFKLDTIAKLGVKKILLDFGNYISDRGLCFWGFFYRGNHHNGIYCDTAIQKNCVCTHLDQNMFYLFYPYSI